MNKGLILLFAAIALFSFFHAKEAKEHHYMQEIVLGEEIEQGHKILFSDAVDRIGGAYFYEKMVKVLDQYDASLFISRETQMDSDIKVVKRYSYINNSQALDNIELVSGSLLGIRDESLNYLSTEDADDENQIGRIMSWNKTYQIEYRTLKQLIDADISLEGYAILVVNQAQIQSIVNDIEQELGVDVQWLIDKSASYRSGWKSISLLLLPFVSMVILLDVMKETKRIGVLRLLGHGWFSIIVRYWNKYLLWFVGLFLCVQFVGIFISYGLLSRQAIVMMQYVIRTGGSLALGVLLAILVPNLYMTSVSIHQLVKNKKPMRLMLITNFIIKLSILLFASSLIATLLSDTLLAHNKMNAFQVWDELDGYYIIPSVKVTGGGEAFYTSKEGVKRQLLLYQAFNEKGAIRADFYEFTELFKKANRNNNLEPYTIRGKINPNYLKRFPIYDINHNPIYISDEDPRVILLVPLLYQPLEEEILEYYNRIKQNDDKETEIIWIENGQEIFTFNIAIATETDNRLTDIILEVGTFKHIKVWDYDCVMAVSGNPLKIYWEGDEAEAIKGIQEVIDSADLTGCTPSIHSLQDTTRLETTVKKETFFSGIIGVLLLLWANIIVTYHYYYCYLNKNFKKIAVLFLLGFNKWRSTMGLGILVVTQFVLCTMISIVLNEEVTSMALLSIFLLIIMEILFYVLFITVQYRQKQTELIKGAVE